MTVDAQQLLDGYVRAWSSHDIAQLLSFFTDDCVYESVARNAVAYGKEELRQTVSLTFTAIPDFQLDVTSSFSTENRIGCEGIMTGTLVGAPPMIPATGKRFSVRFATIMELQGDKIKRNADYWDMLTYLQQVGLLPEAPVG